jgi:DNA-directed RNA polymerase subunit N (RpoN/RPB10)
MPTSIDSLFCVRRMLLAQPTAASEAVVIARACVRKVFMGISCAVDHQVVATNLLPAAL